MYMYRVTQKQWNHVDLFGGVVSGTESDDWDMEKLSWLQKENFGVFNS